MMFAARSSWGALDFLARSSWGFAGDGQSFLVALLIAVVLAAILAGILYVVLAALHNRYAQPAATVTFLLLVLLFLLFA